MLAKPGRSRSFWTHVNFQIIQQKVHRGSNIFFDFKEFAYFRDRDSHKLYFLEIPDFRNIQYSSILNVFVNEYPVNRRKFWTHTKNKKY